MPNDPKKEAEEKLDKAMEELESPEEENEPEDEPQEEEAPEEDNEDTPEEESEPVIDYKKKFSESSREAQRIATENKKINEVIDQSSQIPEPTEEEMVKEWPEWENMEDYSRKLAIQATKARRFQENLAKARGEGKKLEQWNERVDKLLDDPQTLIQYPELEGRVEELRIYATAAPNTKFDVLIPGFLYNAKKAQVKNKGQMMPKGTAGSSHTGKTDNKLSLEEGRKIRETDYNKWKQLVKDGKIKTDL